MLQKLAWLILQVPCIGVWLWIARQEQLAGRDPKIGMALMLGVGTAFVFTALVVWAVEMTGFIRRRQFKAR